MIVDTHTAKKYLVSKPALITKSYSQNKINLLVNALAEADIDTKSKLQAKWEQDPRFLLSALSLWIDRQYHKFLIDMWPPLDSKVQLNQKGHFAEYTHRKLSHGQPLQRQK
jgi:hypothetical protein